MPVIYGWTITGSSSGGGGGDAPQESGPAYLPVLNTFIPDDQQPSDRFGVDVVTYPSLDPGFALLRGLQTLAERLFRRFSTRRNSLTFHPGDGIDLREFLSKGITQREASLIKGIVEEEAKKDEQVDDATAIVSWSLSTETLSIELSVLPSTDNAFTMTMLVTQLDVTLFRVARS